MNSAMVYKFFLYLILIALYIYFFGLDSFDRFKEKSIVTINNIIPISSREAMRNPGKRFTPTPTHPHLINFTLILLRYHLVVS